MCGVARFHGEPVGVIGQQKGRDTQERTYRNFGMPSPEGYRKAMRVMTLAEKMGMPIITLIDTPGAFPGAGAETRGQGSAIAHSIQQMMRVTVPTIAVVIGEGSSGGALAIGVADRVMMLENATYSVISPEGGAAILWRDVGRHAKPPRHSVQRLPTATDGASSTPSFLNQLAGHTRTTTRQPESSTAISAGPSRSFAVRPHLTDAVFAASATAASETTASRPRSRSPPQVAAPTRRQMARPDRRLADLTPEMDPATFCE